MENNGNKAYNPREIEPEIYKLWEYSGYFNPDNLPVSKIKNSKIKNFCIIMPPPNANEALHMGHALDFTIQDALIRFNRMQDKKTLWLPGADHAGFETQVVFEKKLEKEGKSRFQFERSTLYKMIWDYVQQNKHIMEEQARSLGASCDWSREKFTLDPKIVEIVYDTFKKLYDDKLIYRGKRIINWCPKHQTGLSDLEVKYEEREDKLWYFKYPLSSGEGFIVVATTRPETMLGDTAVAVNPKDNRYKKFIDQKVKLPLTNREIPIITDSAVELEFGTGAVKVTPAHDPVDFDIADRHKLEFIEVIGKDGKMTNEVPEAYQGLKVDDARAKVVVDLNALGLMEKEEPYKHSVGACYKCGRTIEPLAMEQWFVKIKPLAEKAIEAVKKGKTRFVTKKYEKTFMHWMRNIKDWNISRQIVWGIRIPAWYKNDQIHIGKEPPKEDGWVQDTDVFDTWFSSGQWPFVTLMTSGQNDLKEFYPTSVMVTAWDILFFWVARMIMMGIYCTGKEPFKQVYIHGLLKDKYGKKMSKSKGNVINPLAVVEQRGADALRMSLLFGSEADSDTPISEEKIIAQQRFANKIWNASKFVMNALGPDYKPTKPARGAQSADGWRSAMDGYTKEDKWILKELEKATKKITTDIEKYKFHEAAQEAYHFFWHKFCDKTIEDVKIRIQKNSKDADAGKLVVWTVLYNSLKLLHPFMPFVTEAIYQKLPSRPKELLMIEKWPK